MSQEAFLTTDKHQRQVEVLIGWDRPLQQLFMVILLVDSEGNEIGEIYSNMMEPDMSSLSLECFISVAEEAGVVIPQSVLDKVRANQKLNQ